MNKILFLIIIANSHQIKSFGTLNSLDYKQSLYADNPIEKDLVSLKNINSILKKRSHPINQPKDPEKSKLKYKILKYPVNQDPKYIDSKFIILQKHQRVNLNDMFYNLLKAPDKALASIIKIIFLNRTNILIHKICIYFFQDHFKSFKKLAGKHIELINSIKGSYKDYINGKININIYTEEINEQFIKFLRPK